MSLLRHPPPSPALPLLRFQAPLQPPPPMCLLPVPFQRSSAQKAQEAERCRVSVVTALSNRVVSEETGQESMGVFLGEEATGRLCRAAGRAGEPCWSPAPSLSSTPASGQVWASLGLDFLICAMGATVNSQGCCEGS